ncbi:MAG: helix-turn-helix domain-containing protein [Prevotella sp.]|nr:helix-turn-helix domain-containing protein [Prevotella sp.]
MSRGQEALPLFHGDNRADCLNLLAITSLRIGNSSQAADYAKQCYELDLKSGDADRISSSLNTLAGIYLGANLPAEAEQYVMKGIDYCRQAGNAPRLATLHGMASEVYHALGDQQKAYDYALEAYNMEQQIGRPTQAAMRQSQMAAALTAMQRFSEAKDCLQKAITQFEADGNIHSLGICCNKMGELMLWETKPDSAVPYFTRAADIFKQMGDLYNEMHSQLGLFNALKDSDPEAAMYKLDRYNELKDTIYSREAAQAMGQASAEIDNATLRANSDEQRSRTRTFIIIAACITLFLLTVVLALVLTIRRRTRRFMSEFNSLATDFTNLKEQYDGMQQNDNEPAEPDTEQTTAEPLADADRLFKEKLDSLVDRQIEDGHIDVATLASEMCMSISSFRRRFTAIVGERPQAYVMRMRMEKAKNLISQDGNATIAEIAARLGFDDKSNFTRTFKRVFGITPSEYAQNIKKDTD